MTDNRNSNLVNAKRNKKDEFYTQLRDIENELYYYRKHFKGKVVYCNCDDPRKSNFFKYFYMNFKFLGLKKLIATCYKTLDDENYTTLNADVGLVLEYEGESDDSNVPREINVQVKQLKGDGDFRSEESIEFLKESDIVVTNPPFSLFREYVAQLIEYDKKFLILGNNNAITYKEIFPLIKENKMWLGNSANKTMEFQLASDYEKWNRTDEDGNKYGKVPAISWFTNLDFPKRHEDLLLFRKYNEKDYPKYDNYNAIEVSRVANIPKDYEGVMGVPITFLTAYNPDQFDILGMTKTPICYQNAEEGQRIKKYENVIQFSKNGKQSSGNKVNDGSALVLTEPPSDKVYYVTDEVDGYLVAQYPRILIKRKKEVE